jgi:tripartite-type tricarboxylate transporter receptor subunit TctC
LIKHLLLAGDLNRISERKYTVLFVSGTLIVTNPFIIKDIPYKPLEELDAVAGYGSLPMVWVANPDLGFKTLADMVAYAHRNPGKLLVSHSGAGTLPYLIEEAFIRKNNLDVQIVPYKTAPQADLDTMAGHVHIGVDNMTSVSPFVRQKQLTALAVTTKKRSALLPEIPSWLEDGSGPFDVSGWYGFVVPKGTPHEVIDTLNKAINTAIQTPEVKTRLDEWGMQFAPQTPDEFRDFMHSEYDKFGQLIKQMGLEPQ